MKGITIKTLIKELEEEGYKYIIYSNLTGGVLIVRDKDYNILTVEYNILKIDSIRYINTLVYVKNKVYKKSKK